MSSTGVFMKNFLIVMALLFQMEKVFSQVGGATSATILYATTTKPFELSTATIVSPFEFTSGKVQARGVAGKEQMKDEMVSLYEDMDNGYVKTIAEVRQPTLRELFAEISSDTAEMDKINA